MIALLAAVLGASLLGSAHCAAMCGAFGCLASGRTGSLRARAPGLASYHAGRLAAYLLLGALAGVGGLGLAQLGASIGLPDAALLAAAVAVAVAGVAIWSQAAGASPGSDAEALGIAARLAPLFRSARDLPTALRGLALGLATGLFPCAWLYTFVATAAASGTPTRGALTMAAFWLGTLPAVSAAALAASQLGAIVAPHRRYLVAATLLVAGLTTLALRLLPHAASHPH